MSMLSFTSTSSNNHQVKNVSFSSYPSIDDDTFARSNTNPITVTTQQGHLGSEEEDGELRVFGAEKYFNGRIDEESPKHQLQLHNKQETTTDITKRHESASIQSESSWNSQSALLRNTKVRNAKKSRGKRFLGSLSCKCVCSDKDSVDIAQNDDVGDINSTRYNLVHAKPVITQDPIITVHDHKDSSTNKETCFSLPRKSLEVFGSKRNDSMNIEERIAKLAWEADPRVVQEEIEFEDNGVYESGSDASSDLFEIESLTGRATCYAPSEASIEWSVVTASAADFSALSDSEDHRFSPSEVGAKAKPIAQRRRPNLLLSCKSHKSVRVAGDAYVASDKVRTRHGSHPMMHVTRFEGASKMIGFDSRQQHQHGFAKHQITRSRSPRPSHLLYIQ